MTTDPQTDRYRHRTAEVEAVQWTGSNADQLRAFCGRDFDGMDPMEPGDWVVKADEDFLVFSPVDFATYYEPAVPAPATSQAEAIASCPGRELDPNPCRCPCYGCKHHCSAHNPDEVPDSESAPAETALRDRIAALAEDLRYVLDYRGPRHAHERPGVWDTSGKPCEHCARLAVVRKNLDAYDADPDAVLAALPTADRPAGEAYRLAVSAALRLGTGATWEAIRDRAEDLTAEVEGLTETSRRLLEQRQEMAAERFAWQERGDQAEAAIGRVRLVLETEAVVGRSAREYRGLITSALMAVEAQQQTETPCGPAPDMCDAEAGEPCANHEREQAHAEGEHCFCGPECTDGIEETGVALARYIADQPMSSIQAAIRILGWPPLRFELADESGLPAVVPAGAGEEPAQEMRAPRSDVGTEFVHQIDNPDGAALDLWETDLAQSGVDTPGCDCGHDGMGLRWHDTACAWKVGLAAEARQAIAAGEPAEAWDVPDARPGTTDHTLTQPVQHAPGVVTLCADCRAKGHTVCADDVASRPETRAPECFCTDNCHVPCPYCPACNAVAQPGKEH
jgi:hypothetical protein